MVDKDDCSPCPEIGLPSYAELSTTFAENTPFYILPPGKNVEMVRDSDGIWQCLGNKPMPFSMEMNKFIVAIWLTEYFLGRNVDKDRDGRGEMDCGGFDLVC